MPDRGTLAPGEPHPDAQSALAVDGAWAAIRRGRDEGGKKAMILHANHPYTPKHFAPQELVPPDVYDELKDAPWKIWILFDSRALITADLLRDFYGPMTVNDWQWGGNYTMSGYRPPDTDVGARYSQHRFGRALDCRFKNVSASQVREDVKRYWELAHTGADTEGADDFYDLTHSPFRFISRIEDFPGMSWFHFDTGNVEGGNVVVFKP